MSIETRLRLVEDETFLHDGHYESLSLRYPEQCILQAEALKCCLECPIDEADFGLEVRELGAVEGIGQLPSLFSDLIPEVGL